MTPQDQKAFLDAVKNLTERQKLTLYNFSTKMLAGTRYSNGADLMHEAIDRVLSDSRDWKRDICIGAFLYKAMESIVSVDHRKKQKNQKQVPYEDWMESIPAVGLEVENEFTLTPEELFEKRQEEKIRRDVMSAARRRLAYDLDAQAVLSGLANESTPAEVRKARGMSEQAYKAARERIAKDIKTHGKGPRR